MSEKEKIVLAKPPKAISQMTDEELDRFAGEIVEVFFCPGSPAAAPPVNVRSGRRQAARR